MCGVGRVAILVAVLACHPGIGPVRAQPGFGEFFGGEQGRPAESTTAVDILSDESVLSAMRLNQGQRNQISAVLKEHAEKASQLDADFDERLKSIKSVGERLRKRAEFRALKREQTTKINAAAETALKGVLSDDQWVQLREQLDQPATTEGNDVNENATPASSNPDVNSTSPRISPPTPRSTNSAASFSVLSANSSGASEGVASASENVSFNFHQALWSDVLRLFTKGAGLTLNLRDVPPGTFTYYDQNQYSSTEALDIMNRFLLQEEFLLVRHDRFLTVIDAKSGIPPNLVKTVAPDELDSRGETELLRVSLSLGDREVEKAAEEIRGLLGPQGTVVPLESANSVVVTDIGTNLIRIRELLEPPPKVGDDELIYRSFALRFIDAPSASAIIGDLFGLQEGVANVSAGRRNASSGNSNSSRRGNDIREFFRSRFGGGERSSRSSESSRSKSSSANKKEVSETKVKITVNRRTNSVLVTATKSEMKLVEEIIQSIDVDDEVDGFANTTPNEPFLQVHELTTASADEVAKTLSVLHPGMVVNEDGRSKRIHVWATSEKHREIETHIQQLDGIPTGQTLAIINTEGTNPFDVESTLASLYEKDPKGAPAIEVDPSGRGLIVKGSVAQIGQVRSFVDQLALAGPYRPQPRTSRLVPVASTNSPAVQDAIVALYPQVTVTKAEVTEESTSASSNQENRRSRGEQRNRDREREERIRRFMEWRSRMFGGGRESGAGRSRGDRGRESRGRSERGGRRDR